MGYNTFFSGSVTIEPPLNDDEISYLRDFADSRRMHRTKGPLYVEGGAYDSERISSDIIDTNKPDPDQPGLWCSWVPTDDGTEIAWNEDEKFYEAGEWMEYLVNRLLSPAAKRYVRGHINEDDRLKSFTCDHRVNGEIYAEGEESDDRWKIKVVDNEVTCLDGLVTYGDEEPEGPSEQEVEEARRSIVGKQTVRVWTLTTDTDKITTQVFGTEQEMFDSLRQNYAQDFAGDDGAMLEELTERQGVVLYIEEHVVEVPA